MVYIGKSEAMANEIEKNIKANCIDFISLLSEGDRVRLFTDKYKFVSFNDDHIAKKDAIFLGKKCVKI